MTDVSLAISTIAYGDGCDPLDRFMAFSRGGFEYVHWSDHVWNASHPDSPMDIAAVRSACEQSGLRIRDAHSIEGSGNDTPFTDKMWGHVNTRRIELLSAVGGKCLVVHPPDFPHPNMSSLIASTIRRLQTLQNVAGEHGVQLAIENVFSPPPSVDLYDAVLERLPADFVGFCFDSGHANMTGCFNYVERYSERLIALHLHDNDGQGDQHLVPGKGTIDWPRILKLIRSTPYMGPLTLEVYKPAAARPAEWCAQTYHTSRALWTE